MSSHSQLSMHLRVVERWNQLSSHNSKLILNGILNWLQITIECFQKSCEFVLCKLGSSGDKNMTHNVGKEQTVGGMYKMNTGRFFEVLITENFQITPSHENKKALKVVSTTFFLVFFKSKRKHLWNMEKCVLFHFKSSFRSRENPILKILDIQISWRHQMPKHEPRNTFYWITWKVDTVC